MYPLDIISVPIQYHVLLVVCMVLLGLIVLHRSFQGHDYHHKCRMVVPCKIGRVNRSEVVVIPRLIAIPKLMVIPRLWFPVEGSIIYIWCHIRHSLCCCTEPPVQPMTYRTNYKPEGSRSQYGIWPKPERSK